jgi:hypothetical protein
MAEMRGWVGGDGSIVLWSVCWVGGALPIASFAVLDWYGLLGGLFGLASGPTNESVWTDKRLAPSITVV